MVDSTFLPFLIRSVDMKADNHNNGKERAEIRGISHQWLLVVSLNGSFVKKTTRESSGYQYHHTNLNS